MTTDPLGKQIFDFNYNVQVKRYYQETIAHLGVTYDQHLLLNSPELESVTEVFYQLSRFLDSVCCSQEDHPPPAPDLVEACHFVRLFIMKPNVVIH